MGVSGAVLFVPLFTILFPLFAYHLEPVTAVQLGIFIELVGFISSTSAFAFRKLIDFRIAGFALIFVIPTSIIGPSWQTSCPLLCCSPLSAWS